jgi:hypothetical protein
LFDAVFSKWVDRRSDVVRKQREAFERECKDTSSTWRRDAFAQWLTADAKIAMCAELRGLRDGFVKELEEASDISIAPLMAL